MKKLFLMAMLATGTLAMSSCSNEDDLASSGQVSTLDPNVVAFSTNGQKGMTRSGATVTSLTTFNVWSSTADGNAYIGTLGHGGQGEAFTYDALSEVFKSDVNHYWPAAGTLNFFASNEFTEMSGYTVGSPDEAFVNYTNDGSQDIVCATVRTGTKTIPYPLLFHHVLSQVKVTAEAKDKTQDLQYRVVGITMTTQDLGRYYYATSTGGIGTWELNDASSTRAYAFGANMPALFEKDGRFASTDYWNILPCVNDIVFSIQYQVIQNGVVISDFTGANAKSVTVSSPGLLSEKKYTYNFKLGIDNNDVITFTSTISDWEDADPAVSDVEVPEPITVITYTASSQIMSYEVGDDIFDCNVLSHTFSNGIGVITLSGNLSTLGWFGLNSMTSITIPESITTLYAEVFANVVNLQSITIPASVTTIGDSAFEYSDLRSITFLNSVPAALGTNVFKGLRALKIYVPSGSVATYKAATGWSEYADMIEAIP